MVNIIFAATYSQIDNINRVSFVFLFLSVDIREFI